MDTRRRHLDAAPPRPILRRDPPNVTGYNGEEIARVVRRAAESPGEQE
jgi:hypothetical protein